MRDKSCKKCIHFGCCMDWQHIQDENLQQRTTTEEDFIQCVNCEDCQFYLDAEIITRQQSKIDDLMERTAVTTLIDDAVVYTPTLEDYNKFKKKFKSESVKEFAEKVIEKVEKARQKYQRLCTEQGDKEDEAMNIHFRGMINLVKEMVGENNG